MIPRLPSLYDIVTVPSYVFSFSVLQGSASDRFGRFGRSFRADDCVVAKAVALAVIVSFVQLIIVSDAAVKQPPFPLIRAGAAVQLG